MTDAASFVVDFRYPHRIIRGSFEQSQKEDTELHALKLIKYTCLGEINPHCSTESIDT